VSEPSYSVVVPTIGRPSLAAMLEGLAAGEGPAPAEVIVVDDRADGAPLPDVDGLFPVKVLRSEGRGPAAARNTGWRAASAEWVAFLDDDVVPEPGWRAALGRDLSGLPHDIAASQGRLRVPLPEGRRPTDWERNVAALEGAQWATADMAYRRDVLDEVGGFDERFPRAFREDADLGARVVAAGYVIVAGERSCTHPVRPADRWVSVRLQAGNADDVLMRALHGAGWRVATGAEPGRNGRHILTAGAAVSALALLAGGRSRPAAVSAAVWLAGTAELAAARIRPGPATADEVATMLLTSLVLAPAAVTHLGRGLAALPRLLHDERAPLGQPRSPLALRPPRLLTRSGRPRPASADVEWRAGAILFDRDGTLIVDRPGCLDPDGVRLMPGARQAVARARRAGLAVGVVTNQSIIGRGHASRAEVDAVNRRVDQLVGPMDTWVLCVHAPEEGCRCRKPAPGLVEDAAAAVGVDPSCCAVVGDIASDMAAAAAAGARGVLVPTRQTRRSEIKGAPVVAADILSAVDLILAGMC
jgi:histidinol-phosphate phosphatase family protein